MKLKKCLIAFLIGFSLLFSGALISCGDTPASNENEQDNELSENNSENETKNKTDKDKESDANKDKDSNKDTSKDTNTDSSTNTDTATDNSTNPTPNTNTETTQSVSVSLSQESVTGTITCADLSFTAPEGYESYDWMIFGSTFSERQINHIETTTNVWTPDADFVTTYGNLFDVGATYVVYVSAMKMVNGEYVLDMFKITFVYGED